MKKSGLWLVSLLVAFTVFTSSCTPAPVADTKPTESGSTSPPQTVVAPAPTPSANPSPNVTPEEKPTAVITPPPDAKPEEKPAIVTPPPVVQPPPPPPWEPRTLLAEPAVAPHKYPELAQQMLTLINEDRAANNLPPVVLAGNAAPQKHAEENLTNSYSSHWGLNGFKPYMRYTINGGVNYVLENVLGTGISEGPGEQINPSEMVAEAERQFMNSPAHRATILNKWNKKVSLGIAYNNNNISIVQNFEGDYIGFSEKPNISGSVLSLEGQLNAGSLAWVVILYDALPQPLTPEQLNAPPYDSAYAPGQQIGSILAPPPPGSAYSNLSAGDVVATTWNTKDGGWFGIKADISQLLNRGTGVYTIVVLAVINGEQVSATNYSIFIQ